MSAPRVAAIDIGSNGLKLTLLERVAPGSVHRLHEEEVITRVSEGLERSGRLDPAAIERTLAALADRVAFARGLGATRVGCVATAGLRGAEGREVFLSRARAEAGVEVRVIDGEEEAALAFAASALGTGGARRLAVDVGGRSTELALGVGTAPDAVASLPLGGVRLTERFLDGDPPTPDSLAALRAHVRAVLDAELPSPRFPVRLPGEVPLVGLSGTVLALVGLALSEASLGKVVARAEGFVLDRSLVAELGARLAQVPAKDRVLGDVIPPGRADVVVAGVLLIEGILDRFEAEHLHVGTGSVGVGLGLRLLAEDEPEAA